MSLTCSICKHSRRTEIEKSVLEKTPLRHVAARFGTSTGALQRHRPHMLAELAVVHRTRESDRAASVYEEVVRGRARAEQLAATCREMFEEAMKAKDHRGALAAVRAEREMLGEARQYTAFRAELERERPDVEAVGESPAQQLLARLRQIVRDAQPETPPVIDVEPQVRCVE